MKYVLFYEASPDVLATAPLHGAAHRAHWQSFLADGTLLMVGPFSNPKEGALAVFTTRDAAERFANGDPFVINGVVDRWYVREWMEAIAT